MICAGMDPRHHGHIALAVVLVVNGVSTVIVVAFILYSKKGYQLPIPDHVITFANLIFFNNEQPRTDVPDTNVLVENAEEETLST